MQNRQGDNVRILLDCDAFGDADWHADFKACPVARFGVNLKRAADGFQPLAHVVRFDPASKAYALPLSLLPVHPDKYASFRERESAVDWRAT